jgi:hypothetical protein
MDIYSQILEIYPELTPNDFMSENNTIILMDDGDGIQYIAKWNIDAPIPKGLKLGK